MYICQAHRWKKRGLAVTPARWGVHWFHNYAVYVAVHPEDGSVAVSHGGTEIGQGIHTMVGVRIPLFIYLFTDTYKAHSP